MSRNKNFLFSKAFLICVSVFLLGINLLLGVLLTRKSINAITSQIRGRMLDISKTAAAILNGDELAALKKEDYGTEPYQRALTILRTYQEQINLEYIYGIRDMGDGTFTFTIDPDPVSPGDFGSPVVSTESLRQASQGIPSVDKEPYQDVWGRFYSAYSPVFASDGSVAGIIGVDFRAEWFEKQVHYFLSIIVFVCFISLLGGGGIVFLITAKLRKRFSLLNIEMRKMSDDIEELAEEMSLRTSFIKASDASEKKNIRRPAGSGVEELDDRLQFIRREIREYIDKAHKMAYIDALTGVGNRNAYLSAIKNLDKKITDGMAEFSIAIFDINELKNANDNLGHECGDKLIVATAEILKDVFCKEEIFRIGGDEFVVIMENTGKEKAESLFSDMSKKTEEKRIQNGEKEMSVAVSKGLAIYDKGEDTSVKDVFQRADNAMYEDKAAYYKSHADRRRKR